MSSRSFQESGHEVNNHSTVEKNCSPLFRAPHNITSECLLYDELLYREVLSVFIIVRNKPAETNDVYK